MSPARPPYGLASPTFFVRVTTNTSTWWSPCSKSVAHAFDRASSLISVGISQALESDRGVPVDTGCSPELTSRLCEALLERAISRANG